MSTRRTLYHSLHKFEARAFKDAFNIKFARQAKNGTDRLKSVTVPIIFVKIYFEKENAKVYGIVLRCSHGSDVTGNGAEM